MVVRKPFRNQVLAVSNQATLRRVLRRRVSDRRLGLVIRKQRRLLCLLGFIKATGEAGEVPALLYYYTTFYENNCAQHDGNVSRVVMHLETLTTIKVGQCAARTLRHGHLSSPRPKMTRDGEPMHADKEIHFLNDSKYHVRYDERSNEMQWLYLGNLMKTEERNIKRATDTEPEMNSRRASFPQR